VLSASPQAQPAELEPATIRAAQAGDRHARRVLVVLYQDRVFRLLRRMIAPSEMGDAIVDDLAQETFLRAFAALDRFDIDASARLSTWLLTIATRLAIDALRNASRRRTQSIDSDGIIDEQSRLGHAEDRLLAQMLRRAMADLPPEQRAVFILREYHGLDYDEIARILDARPGTVASRLSRAREALQRALGGQGR
jgi:RNA polymerase sigma-70 factor (ECF subfamily)